MITGRDTNKAADLVKELQGKGCDVLRFVDTDLIPVTADFDTKIVAMFQTALISSTHFVNRNVRS